MAFICQIILWISALAVAGTYFLYPLALVLLRVFRKRHQTSDELPSVTLVISAFNEAAVIREKIENSLAIDYPPELFEIMVISDESDDGTDEIVTEYESQGVVLQRQQPRRGKSLGLTRFVPDAKGEIIVFSDANSMYDAQSIRHLVRHFADPKMGYVVGHQRYIDSPNAASESESLYWRYETFLKKSESQIGSVVGGDGAIYALRAELFLPLREDDINDFYIPLKAVERGYRGVFDDEAICYEETAADFGGEFRRKVRIVNRSLRAVLRAPRRFNPFRVGGFAFQLIVHKLLRWFVPFFLLALLATSAYLATRGYVVYTVFLAIQGTFYLAALLWYLPGLRRFKPLYIAHYFCLVNLAAGIGVLSYLRGHKFITWRPERTGPESPQAESAGQ